MMLRGPNGIALGGLRGHGGNSGSLTPVIRGDVYPYDRYGVQKPAKPTFAEQSAPLRVSRARLGDIEPAPRASRAGQTCC